MGHGLGTRKPGWPVAACSQYHLPPSKIFVKYSSHNYNYNLVVYDHVSRQLVNNACLVVTSGFSGHALHLGSQGSCHGLPHT